MAAVAPLLAETTRLDDPFDEEVEPELIDPAARAEEIAASNLLLARESEVPDSVRFFLETLADEVSVLPAGAALRIDPYLLVSLQRAIIAALRALDSPDPGHARREVRIRLEQLRQVYRDLADARPIYEGRPAKALAQWLTATVDVPQSKLAELLGVSPRTFQRWVSESDPIEPRGDEARRVRVVVNLVSHLRHALTASGTIDWFQTAHPMANGHAPADLLEDPAALPELTRLAASTRSQLAS